MPYTKFEDLMLLRRLLSGKRNVKRNLMFVVEYCLNTWIVLQDSLAMLPLQKTLLSL